MLVGLAPCLKIIFSCIVSLEGPFGLCHISTFLDVFQSFKSTIFNVEHFVGQFQNQLKIGKITSAKKSSFVLEKNQFWPTFLSRLNKPGT